jgi:hypothetical protein
MVGGEIFIGAFTFDQHIIILVTIRQQVLVPSNRPSYSSSIIDIMKGDIPLILY